MLFVSVAVACEVCPVNCNVVDEIKLLFYHAVCSIIV